MKKYEGLKKNCKVIKIDDILCDLNGMVYVEKNYQVFFELQNLTREQLLILKDEKAKVIYVQTDDEYITATVIHIQQYSYKHKSDNIEDMTISVRIEAENTLFGNEVIENNNDVILFEGFTCRITDGNELIGITPYESLEDEIRNNSQGTFKIDSKIRSLVSTNGLSFFSYPRVYREETEIRLGYQSVVQYRYETNASLDEIKEKINDIMLLFEILSGEYISTTSVRLFKSNKGYDLIGNCNFPKYDLLQFKNNTFDKRYYLRKGLFKISDFKEIDKIYIKWVKIIQENKLAFNSYRELLLDEEMKIITANKFLKVMQIIEGIEREETSEYEKREFNNHKGKIMEMLTEKEDKEFISQYCIYNRGDNFRKCLKKFIYFGIKTISGLSNTKCEKYSKTLIDKIKKDRDTYTHASHYTKPVLRDEELMDIVYVLKVFFRIKILSMLGIDNELIRKRLAFDRYFIGHYQNLFNLKIEIEDNNRLDTGEFDEFMWGF